MKILFISKQLPRLGGRSGDTIVFRRIEALARRGHEVGLAAFCDPEKHHEADPLRELLFEMELLPHPQPTFAQRLRNSCFTRVPSRYSFATDLRMSKTIGDMVDRSHYDVAIAEFSSMGQHLFRNPYLPAVRKIISCHRSATIMGMLAIDVLGWTPGALRQRLKLRGLRKYEFAMYRGVDRILALTPWEKYRLLNQAPNLRISVLPCGVDTTSFTFPEQAATDPVLVFTGHYSEEPNEDAVLWFIRHAWAQVLKEHPDALFYVVGPDPTPAICDLAKKKKGIIVTGMVDDVRPYLAKAQVFVCPVRMGTGMRGKVLEAMAAGVPVVATSLAVEGITVQTGDNCFLADNPDIIARYTNLLLSDKVLRDEMAQRARSMVSDRFSWNSIGNSLDTLVRKIVRN